MIARSMIYLVDLINSRARSGVRSMAVCMAGVLCVNTMIYDVMMCIDRLYVFPRILHLVLVLVLVLLVLVLMVNERCCVCLL